MTYYIVFSSFAYVLKFPQEKPISTASWSMFTAANFHRGRRPICYEKNEHLCSSKVPKDVRTYQNWIFSCLCLFLTDLLLPPMALILQKVAQFFTYAISFPLPVFFMRTGAIFISSLNAQTQCLNIFSTQARTKINKTKSQLQNTHIKYVVIF